LIFKVRFLPGFFLSWFPLSAISFVPLPMVVQKDFRFNRGYRCREACSALPQKKQKGSRHIRFAKNQW
jgi:hypothetical protein